MSSELMRAGIVSQAIRDDAVQELIAGRFYSGDIPDAPEFPYLTLGRSEESSDGSVATTVHIWTRAGGRSQALSLSARLRSALNGAAVSLGARGDAMINIQFGDIFRSGDGRTTHGVLRLRALPSPADDVKGTSPQPDQNSKEM